LSWLFPRQRDLVEDAERDLTSGALKSGDRLPSIHDLTQETELAQNTIRAAVDVLREEGLVVTAPGRGVFEGPCVLACGVT
jgi:DNA-binding GntR family transcriptional regulator